ANEDHRAGGLAAPIPVLTAVGVTVARGLRQQGVRGAALLGLLSERVVRRELAARVQREHFFEGHAGALADAADLVGDRGEIALDRSDPPGRVLPDLGPLEPGDLLERLAVIRDGVADLFPRRLAVLAPDLTVRAGELDRR